MRGRFATLREYPVLFLSTALSGGCSSWAVRASVAAAAAAMPQRIGLRFMLPLLSMANNTSRQGVLSVETTHASARCVNFSVHVMPPFLSTRLIRYFPILTTVAEGRVYFYV
jgi:hypothetical protein